ncbi:MAG: geranylgeranylglycerol-phosphate geranylgeranyltransferase [Flavobacteriaceae bacterium]
MQGYLKIIRPINLLLIMVAQFLIKYFLFEAFDVALAINSVFNYSLLVFATLFIAAGGNVINDINDAAIDKINKPTQVIVGKIISEKAAYNYYMLLTVVGVGCGFIVSNLVEKPGLAVVFILIAALLYWYATFIKSMLLVGNLLISILVGFSILIVVLLDIFPVLNETDKPIQILLSKTLLGYAAIAFYINLMREVVKDIQDINGDKNGGRTTLPIVLGVARTTTMVFAMGVFAFFLLVFFSYNQLYNHPFLLFYFIFLLGGPLLIFCIKSWNASKPKDYKALSLLLKIIMFIGVGSIVFYAQIFKG